MNPSYPFYDPADGNADATRRNMQHDQARCDRTGRNDVEDARDEGHEHEPQHQEGIAGERGRSTLRHDKMKRRG